MKDFLWVVFLMAALLSGLWMTSEATRGMTLICVKVVADREGLQQALEQCK